MSNKGRTEPVRRSRHFRSDAVHVALAVLVSTMLLVGPLSVHGANTHASSAPLNLPVAPRVIAVTPNYELVGVLSGRERLTIFLHYFETGEPVRNAKLTASADSDVDAVAKED